MEYGNSGKSGLKASHLCLGMMSYGAKEVLPWALDEDEAIPFIKRALEAGIKGRRPFVVLTFTNINLVWLVLATAVIGLIFHI